MQVDKTITLIDLPEDGVLTLYVDSDVALSSATASWARKFPIDKDVIAYSDDVVQWCAGVMLFRTSPTVSRWWNLVKTLSEEWDKQDQDVIHELRCRPRPEIPPIKSVTIPGDFISNWATTGLRRFFATGESSAPEGCTPWHWHGENILVPEKCVAWHANWTVGIEKKIAMLRIAQAQLSERWGETPPEDK